LAIFDETTTAAIDSYFPTILYAANMSSCFHKLVLICNSKQRFNTSNRLGNAAVLAECQLSDDSKEVATSIAGYIAKTLLKKSSCICCKEKIGV
jgi:ribosomal protein S17E